MGGKGKTAIHDLSLTIRQGENIGIVGGNGSGKSTLLKILAGIYKPTSGVVVIHRPIRSVFIGLQSGFIPYLSGIQNIKMTGFLLGMSRKEINNKIKKIVEYSELGERINRPLFTYSSGMRSRLAFSVSVFSEPDLLLIDEAMSAGDKEFRKKSSITLKEMINSSAAVVLVSHEQNYLRKICNKAIWFDDGNVKEIGECKKVLEKYADQ